MKIFLNKWQKISFSAWMKKLVSVQNSEGQNTLTVSSIMRRYLRFGTWITLVLLDGLSILTWHQVYHDFCLKLSKFKTI